MKVLVNTTRWHLIETSGKSHDVLSDSANLQISHHENALIIVMYDRKVHGVSDCFEFLDSEKSNQITKTFCVKAFLNGI